MLERERAIRVKLQYRKNDDPVIIGCVLTSNVIAQRLTDYLWLGNSRVIDDAAAIRLARVFYSLRLANDELRNYYLNLSPHTAKNLRFFPSVASYRTDTQTVNFQYQRRLQSDKACVTFLAVERPPASMDGVHGRAGGRQIVVKFVERYGEEAHRILALNGLAPKLLYCGPISSDPGLWYGERRMVVMEYIEGRTAQDVFGSRSIPPSVHKKIMEAVELLHQESMVHGDLRKPNIMIENGEANPKIIDFDWAGREGEVRYRYPLHLSGVVRWPEGVCDYELIQREHDEEMVQRL